MALPNTVVWLTLTLVLLLCCHANQASAQTEVCTLIQIADKALFGLNGHVMRDSSLDECKAACLENRFIPCLSFDYMRGFGTCYLSSASKDTNPGDFRDHSGVDYYEKYCETPTTTSTTTTTTTTTTTSTTSDPEEGCEKVYAVLEQGYALLQEVSATLPGMSYLTIQFNILMMTYMDTNPTDEEQLRELACRIAAIKTVQELADFVSIPIEIFRAQYEYGQRMYEELGGLAGSVYMVRLVSRFNVDMARLGQKRDSMLPVNRTYEEVYAITEAFVQEMGADCFQRLMQYALIVVPDQGELSLETQGLVDPERLANALLSKSNKHYSGLLFTLPGTEGANTIELASNASDFIEVSGLTLQTAQVLNMLNLNIDLDYVDVYMKIKDFYILLSETMDELNMYQLQ